MPSEKSPATPSAPPKLEELVVRLEEIVSQLESGEADLEKSIELFREGKRLGGQALERLDGLERRVQLVLQGADGELKTQDFEPNS